MKTSDTAKIIADDLADIEAMRAKLAAELAIPETDKAIQAGVEAYAKQIVQDLADHLAPLRESGSCISLCDFYQARINAILKLYPLFR